MEPFKNLLGAARVSQIAHRLHAGWPDFPVDRFVADATQGLDDLELKARVDHVARALQRALPADFPQAARVLVGHLPTPFNADVANGADFGVWALTRFVSIVGVDHPDESLDALHALTQRFTAEFDIRPFLKLHAARTLARLASWTRDPSEHVRRLVSEGTRTRLPWGERLQSFIDDPSPVWPLLEALRDDPSEYVRRSVANNLNDLTKDHPDAVLAVCGRWLREVPTGTMQRLVRHALRGLVKAGNADALGLLGAHVDAALALRDLLVSSTVRIGEELLFSFAIYNAGDGPADVIIDYRISFATPRGPRAPKVFKLGRAVVAGGQSRAFTRRHALRDVSIRRHHPGVHVLEVQVNGKVLGSAEVMVTS